MQILLWTARNQELYWPVVVINTQNVLQWTSVLQGLIMQSAAGIAYEDRRVTGETSAGIKCHLPLRRDKFNVLNCLPLPHVVTCYPWPGGTSYQGAEITSQEGELTRQPRRHDLPEG